MAITSYEKNGKTYYRVYIQERSNRFCNIRVQRSKAGIENEAEARREEKKLTRLVYEQVARLEAKGITWKELIYRWEISAKSGLVGKKYCRGAIVDDTNTLYKHTHVWMDKRLRDLGRADGRHVVNTLFNDSYSSSRIKHVKGIINRMWNWGTEEGLIAEEVKSPVHGIQIESEKNQYKPILTLEEIKKLLYEAEVKDHPWRLIWAVAILTGMRSGELYALKWADVDFDNNIVRITKSYSPRIKGVKSTKNSEWRNAHISPDLKNVFIQLKTQSLDGEYVLPRASGWKEGAAGKILRNFLVKIGIEKYVNFHTLRACFATHVLSSGVEPTKVMKMGGWADFKTFQIYVRMAGVDVKGVTDDFKVMPNLQGTDNVLKLR
ncbi:MAG: hypothetical protein A2X86_17645 [Bdellovibrionales bacterium GWA2_49_15]|nr:MAG: hypothetical protein A2X86_17645 [Bdellovibrionales bacterium GWA2_49_15]